VIHGSRDSAEQTVRSLRSHWISVGFDHPDLLPSVRARIRHDFESGEVGALVVEIANNQGLTTLPRPELIVVAGGWDSVDGSASLSAALCQHATEGAFVLAILVRGTADEAFAAGFVGRIGGAYSEHSWSEEGDAVAALQFDLPPKPSTSTQDYQGNQVDEKAESIAHSVEPGQTCPRCGKDNDLGRRRCMTCHGLLDATEPTTRS
jgi:hypothetical protein